MNYYPKVITAKSSNYLSFYRIKSLFAKHLKFKFISNHRLNLSTLNIKCASLCICYTVHENQLNC